MKAIPQWLIDKMGSCPAAGGGVHAWLYSTARQLHAHMQPGEIEAFLRGATAHVDRRVTDREINDAVANSQVHAWQPTGKGWQGFTTQGITRQAPAVRPDLSETQQGRWPLPSPSERECRIAETVSAPGNPVICLETLRQASPASVEGSVDDWIDRMFPGAEWLCLSHQHPSNASTRRVEEWSFGPADRCDLIVPSPMLGPTGRRQDGKESRRCLDNTGARRWLVIEFDSGTLDEQVCLHWHLREAAAAMGWPTLRLAVYSGSKSLHGWYGPVSDEEQAHALFSYARLLGADPATWTRCQLIRLPAAVRLRDPLKGWQRHVMPPGWEELDPPSCPQTVYYYEPEE